MKLINMSLSIIMFVASTFKNSDPKGNNEESLQSEYEVIIYPNQQIMTSQFLLSTTLTHRSFSYPQYTEAVSRAESTDPEQIAPKGIYTHVDSNNGAQLLPALWVFRDYKTYFLIGTKDVMKLKRLPIKHI